MLYDFKKLPILVLYFRFQNSQENLFEHCLRTFLVKYLLSQLPKEFLLLIIQEINTIYLNTLELIKLKNRRFD
jgi:hypothetical protein